MQTVAMSDPIGMVVEMQDRNWCRFVLRQQFNDDGRHMMEVAGTEPRHEWPFVIEPDHTAAQPAPHVVDLRRGGPKPDRWSYLSQIYLVRARVFAGLQEERLAEQRIIKMEEI